MRHIIAAIKIWQKISPTPGISTQWAKVDRNIEVIIWKQLENGPCQVEFNLLGPALNINELIEELVRLYESYYLR